jgi:hypothetical protein
MVFCCHIFAQACLNNLLQDCPAYLRYCHYLFF